MFTSSMSLFPTWEERKQAGAKEAGRGGPLLWQVTSPELYIPVTSLRIQGAKLAVGAA